MRKKIFCMTISFFKINKLNKNMTVQNEDIKAYFKKNSYNFKNINAIAGDGISNVHDIESTPDGGYVVVGRCHGEIDIDNNGEVDINIPIGFAALIVKYDSSDNIEWFKSFELTRIDEFSSIDVTSDGEYIVGGYEYGENQEDAIVMKFDKSGNEIWKRTIGGIYEDQMNDVKVLKNGDIIGVGRFASTSITINNTTINNEGINNGFVICYDANGNYKWHKAIEGDGNIEPTSITETSQGVVISVNYTYRITFDNNSLYRQKEQNAVIIAYSLDGTYQWNLAVGEATPEQFDDPKSISKLVTNTEDEIFAIGSFLGDMEVGSRKINTPCYGGGFNTVVFKVNPKTGKFYRTIRCFW